MMKRILLLGLILLVATALESTAEIKGVFEQKAAAARAAYDQGDYAQAIKEYLDLKNQGLESAALYYNLGNAEFKSGHLGRAIAYYRWALKRAPGDEDIRYNLTYARSLVQKPKEQAGALGKLFHVLLYRFSGQTMALAALAAYLIFCIIMGVLIWRRGQGQLWRWAGSIVGVLFFLLAAWASARIVVERNVRWGVIVVNQAEARNGPGEENQVGFIVPEGREVRILGYEKEWKAIGLPQEGYKGWVRASEVWEDE